MSDKHTYLKLPNGDLIRADSIVAVRLLDEEAAYAIKPRVVVEYGKQEQGRFGESTVIYAHSDKHRDQIANKIIDAIVGVGHRVQVIHAPIP
jgi:hypothetical protein